MVIQLRQKSEKLTCSKKEEVDAGVPVVAASSLSAATSGSDGVAVSAAAGVAAVGGCSGGSVRAVDAALLFSAVGGGGISSSEETLYQKIISIPCGIVHKVTKHMHIILTLR